MGRPQFYGMIVCLISIFPRFLHAQINYRLHDFGIDGSLTPRLLGERPSDAFFTKPFFGPYLQKRDFTLYFDSDDLKSAEREAGAPVLMEIENWDEAFSDIIFATVDEENNAANYLIRLSPYEKLKVLTDDLMSASHVFFISVKDFSLSFATLSNDGQRVLQTLRAESPLVKTNDYEFFPQPGSIANECRDFVVSLMRVEDRSGVYIDAWFERVVCPESPRCGGESIPPQKAFEINVYWPDSSTLHHAARGQGYNCSNEYCEQLLTCLPECQMYTYATHSVVSGTELNWRHVRYETTGLYQAISFDNVLYANQCGVAVCGRPPYTGDCANDPTVAWKVYHPGWLCF